MMGAMAAEQAGKAVPVDRDELLVESSGRSWAVTEPDQSLALLSWAPDSRNLAFVFVDGNTSSTQELDTATAASLSDARPLAVPLTAGWGYLGTTGEFGAVRNGRAVALDPDTGATRRDLFAFDPELEIGGSPPTLRGATSCSRGRPSRAARPLCSAPRSATPGPRRWPTGSSPPRGYRGRRPTPTP
jgi:hypothetical protein